MSKFFNFELAKAWWDINVTEIFILFKSKCANVAS
jgi:hypothetical protein